MIIDLLIEMYFLFVNFSVIFKLHDIIMAFLMLFRTTTSRISFKALKKFLSVILIFLACFGFTAKLILLDQLYGTEFVAKECNEADENGEKEKKEKEAKEQITFCAETGFLEFAFLNIQAHNHTSFSEGYVSGPYNPPDFQ
jgi:hypothetical protein